MICRYASPVIDGTVVRFPGTVIELKKISDFSFDFEIEEASFLREQSQLRYFCSTCTATVEFSFDHPDHPDMIALVSTGQIPDFL